MASIKVNLMGRSTNLPHMTETGELINILKSLDKTNT